MKYDRTSLIVLLGGVILIASDQLLKHIIRQSDAFYVCNPNIAFGLHVSGPFFWISSLGAILFILWLGCQRIKNGGKTGFFWLALVLIIAGALSNLTDRLILGCVIDFIDFRVWPAFNLADALIVLGAGIWLVKELDL